MQLIDNLTVVTMDQQRRILADAAIVIDQDRIVAVESAGELREQYPDAERIDAAGMVAIPGLIDTHAHADQSLLRGLGDQMHWIPFIDDIIV